MSEVPLMPFGEVAHLSLRRAALVYAGAEFAVFPCWPGTKDPATTHGYKEATTNLEQVSYWWRRNPNANIGLATGTRVDVLDIDVHTAGTGYPVLQRLHGGGLIHGWSHVVRSPSGGLHLYYPADPNRPNRTWSRGTKHVDLRGTGGYIITVPSRVLINGIQRRYEVLGSPRAGVPVDGARIRELLTPRRPARPPRPLPDDASERVRGLRAWLSQAQEGNRNSSLFWAACRVVELGASEADTLAYLGDVAERIGLADQEIVATIGSAHRTASVDLTRTSSATVRLPPTLGRP